MTNAQMDERIAEMVVHYGLVSPERLERAQTFRASRGSTLAGALLGLRVVEATQLTPVLEEITGFRSVDPSLVQVYPDFVERMNRLIPPAVVLDLWAFPIQQEGGTLHVAMLNPTDQWTTKALEWVSGCKIAPLVAHEAGMAAALEKHYGAAPWVAAARTAETDGPSAIAEQTYRDATAASIENYIRDAAALVARTRDLLDRDPSKLEELVRDPAVIRLVHQVLARCIETGASDLHIEPTAAELRLRLRVDGAMRVAWSMPLGLARPLVERLKTMAGFPPGTTAATLDGAITQGLAWGRSVDMRLSIVRSVTGDTAVLRVIERTRGSLSLRDLGADAETDARLQRATSLPNGLILVTGPTGSGKTSTLYAIVEALNRSDCCIMTAEDPVEIRLSGVVQVQCDEKLGFATVLRSFLRQDPDVLLVGEIRDAETAEVALKAALTGHLVLSTLHTNDSVGAVLRLTNMGLEPFLIASALRLVVAQRLLRRLCPKCRTAPAKGAKDEFGEWTAPGCEHCHGTGYKGRTGVFETLWVTEELEELISKRTSARDLRAAGRRGGLVSLREAALASVRSGETSMAEAIEHTMGSETDVRQEVSHA